LVSLSKNDQKIISTKKIFFYLPRKSNNDKSSPFGPDGIAKEKKNIIQKQRVLINFTEIT
jgi:hypothetical protein